MFFKNIKFLFFCGNGKKSYLLPKLLSFSHKNIIKSKNNLFLYKQQACDTNVYKVEDNKTEAVFCSSKILN